MESTSNKKWKLTLEKEACGERNAYYKKLQREQEKKQKRRQQKTAEQPEAVEVKDKAKVTDFCPRQVRLKEVEAKAILSRGKVMVSAALNAAKPKKAE